MSENINTQSSAVTIEDVRNALADTDPATTNANAVRTLIGRGSYATIQRHLETLRAERTESVSTNNEVQLPKPPQDLINHIWSAAWNAAESSVNKQLSSALLQLDALKNELVALQEDRDSLILALDSAKKAAEDARSFEDEAVENERNMRQKWEFQLRKNELDLHNHELEKSRWETERVTLKAELDRVIDRLAETKSLLHEKQQAT